MSLNCPWNTFESSLESRRKRLGRVKYYSQIDSPFLSRKTSLPLYGLYLVNRGAGVLCTVMITLKARKFWAAMSLVD